MAIIETNQSNQAQISGINSKVTEFKINESAHAFRIIADNLYANKIRAVVRETISNANDSHIAAKIEKPVQIHVPTSVEPWYAVKDQGLGMSPTTIETVFARVFESTKNTSNEQVGGLGLGAKAPFAYNTNQFTITSVWDGMCYIFAAFINDSGKPAIVQMAKFDTPEHNGVEIKLAVASNDIRTFVSEINQVIRWYKHIPTDMNGDTLQPFTVTLVDITDTVKYGANHSMVVMGYVEYPLEVPEALYTQFTDAQLTILKGRGLVYFADIGAVDFQASREQLAYTAKTIHFLKREIDKATATVKINVDEIIATETNVYKVWEKLGKLASGVFSSFVSQQRAVYFKNVKNSVNVDDIAKECNVDLRYFSKARYGKSVATQSVTSRTTGELTINFATQLVIVNDLKRSQATRIAKEAKNNDFWYMQPVDFAKKADYATVKALLHTPPTEQLVSKEYPVDKATKVAEQQVLVNSQITSYHTCAQDVNWNLIKLKLDTDTPQFYVAMNNYEPTDFVRLDELNNLIIAAVNHFGMKDLRVYGVRQHSIAQVKANPNWIEFKSHMIARISKLNQSDIANLDRSIAKEHVAIHRDEKLLEILPVAHPISEVLKVVPAYHHSREARYVTQLLKYARPNSPIVKYINEMVEKITVVNEKYKMLAYMSGAPASMKLELINMIDKESTTT